MCAGVYTTNSPDACSYVALDCKAQLFFVEDDDQLKKVLSVSIITPVHITYSQKRRKLISARC